MKIQITDHKTKTDVKDSINLINLIEKEGNILRKTSEAIENSFIFQTSIIDKESKKLFLLPIQKFNEWKKKTLEIMGLFNHIERKKHAIFWNALAKSKIKKYINEGIEMHKKWAGFLNTIGQKLINKGKKRVERKILEIKETDLDSTAIMLKQFNISRTKQGIKELKKTFELAEIENKLYYKEIFSIIQQ